MALASGLFGRGAERILYVSGAGVTRGARKEAQHCADRSRRIDSLRNIAARGSCCGFGTGFQAILFRAHFCRDRAGPLA
jgi:hypothetical protein